MTNRQITLASRPHGEPQASDFALVEGPIPQPAAGEALVQAIYLSIDPYMRGRISAAKSYAATTPIGGLVGGGTVGRVIESRSPDLKPGDYVQGYGHWQEYWTEPASALRKLDPAAAPISTAVGVLGMPGFTAWYGLTKIGRPKAGETVVVSAASGAVGAQVAQLAKLAGARVVGIAGDPRKLGYLRDTLGLDAMVSHRSPNFASELANAAGKGIDVYYENVGGAVLEAVIPLLNPGARIPLCGLIAQYNATELPPGPNKLPLLMRAALTNRLLLQGFIISDHPELFPDFLAAVAPLVKEGRLHYREDIVQGLEATVPAFQGLLRGENFGKLLVQLGEDPSRA